MKPLLVCAALALPLFAAETPKTGAQRSGASSPKAEGMEFDSVYVVFLRRPANPNPYDEAKLQEVQKGHLAHLGELYKSGKIAAAGPFDEQDDAGLRGLAVYPASLAKDEVRKLAEDDPAVQAGRLKVEIVRWYFQKGAVEFPRPAWSVPK
jgi:uncharacterized protein YciI